MPKKETYTFDHLRNLAKDDPLMHQLMQAYDYGHFTSDEEFLTCAVITLAEVKNALHKHIEELHTRQGPPPIVLNVTSGEAERILKDLKR